jgi:hypothetical protein
MPMSMECTFAIDYFSTIFPELIKMDICIFYKHHFQSTKQERNYLLLFWWRTKSSNRKLKPKPEITVLKVWERFRQMSLKILLEKLFGLTQWWIKHIDRTTVVFLHGKKYARPTNLSSRIWRWSWTWLMQSKK